MLFYDNKERDLITKKVLRIKNTFGIEDKFSTRQGMLVAFEEGRNFKNE